jgi:ribonucleoside-diphosphate reductase alpha chain
VWDGQGSQILSTPDAIGKVLERYIENREKNREERRARTAPAVGVAEPVKAAPGAGPKSLVTCPECGSTVEHVSGCVVCYNCGWSKC